MPTIPCAIEQFRAHLQRRNYAVHTVESYLLDLQLFFAPIEPPLHHISFHEVERFIDQQHHNGLSPTTINRCL
jgi:site-specific recombinase XerD